MAAGALRRISIIAVVASIAVPTLAGAQDAAPSEGSLSAAGSLTSLTTVSVIGVGLTAIGAAVYGSYTTTTKKDEKAAEGPAKAAAAYLRAQELQLKQDLAAGAGPTIDDLAAMAHIRRDHLPRFGQLLRANRAELLSLAEPAKLTPDRALAFLRRVGDLTRADEILAVNAESFLARHGG